MIKAHSSWIVKMNLQNTFDEKAMVTPVYT